MLESEDQVRERFASEASNRDFMILAQEELTRQMSDVMLNELSAIDADLEWDRRKGCNAECEVEDARRKFQMRMSERNGTVTQSDRKNCGVQRPLNMLRSKF